MAAKSLSIGELPPELMVQPNALVAFTGLDITNNSIHKSIWEFFSVNRRQNRVPLQFKLLEESHQFPSCKQKRTSYEWYVPKGLLKTNWMNKHLSKVPALYVLYVDLDWDHPQWNDAMHQCATRVLALRGRLFDRNSRVALVLIQRNTSLPPGEDILAAQHAAALCSACDLTPKSLFVLPHSDHLQGYVTRLEIAFNELTKTYYSTEARAVKAHQDFLSKTTHQLLFVRHQFKMGFFNELKQDNMSALKNYRQAYSNLMEVRTTDTNLLEVKTVAGFINYKICKLLFLMNTPREAISQFRKHIDTFKLKKGCKELLFEHLAWTSKQYEHFGDLFDDAIKEGLAAIQIQHPGFYYQQAAHHATLRKENCRKLLCLDDLAYPVEDPLVNEESMEFYGQRPWRPAKQNLEPLDPNKEKEGIQALQYREATSVNHSKIIIPLLNNAVNQFKKYRCPRSKRQLMVLMGEEYCHNQEYSRALVLLSKVSWDYRSEKWWCLLSGIFKTALKCAYLSANIQQYISFSLEMIGTHIDLPIEEKTRIQQNMLKIVNKEMPEAEVGCIDKCIAKAKTAWNTVLAAEPQIFTIELNNIMAFVECKTRFAHDSFNADQPVQFTVDIRSVAPLAIHFEKLSVLFNNKAYNDECVLTNSVDNKEKELNFLPSVSKSFSFSFIPHENDVGHVIQITSVLLQLGSEGGYTAVLYWANGGTTTTPNAGFTSFNPASSTSVPFTRITHRDPQIHVTLDHEAPALQDEFYPITVNVKNDEKSQIFDIKLIMTISNESSQVLQNTHLCVDEPSYHGNVVSSIDPIDIDGLQHGQSDKKNFFVKFLSKEVRNFQLQVSYKIETDVGKRLTVMCMKTESFSVNVVDPFDMSVQTLDYKFDELKYTSCEEPFVIVPNIKCISPWPIIIETSHLGLSRYVNTVHKSVKSQLENLHVKTDDVACECICIAAPQPNPAPVPMGEYTVQWKRESVSELVPFVQTTFVMPSVLVKSAQIYVQCKIPSCGVVRTALPVSYTIHNRADTVLQLEIVMDSSEAFMFSGHKQNNFRLLPRDEQRLNFNFYPLMCGYVLLPYMRIKLNPKSETPINLDAELQKMIPTHVYIMPQGKTNNNINEHQAMLISQ